MTKKQIRSLLLGACAVVSFASVAGAQDFFAPRTEHYRFIPRFSVLTESGGIYPRETDFRVRGEFDLVVGDRPAGDPWTRRARFDDVDAWASHPILAYVENLDRVLNLSGLKGQQLPVAAPFAVYRFEGTTQDGSSVKLIAAEMGPWLRMRGETTPPVGSADMFSYRLRALAHTTPFADRNEDGTVDGVDLHDWIGSPTRNGADLLNWQRQLGETAPSVEMLDASLDAALASLGGAAGAIPEPGSGMLGAAAGLLLLTARRRSS